MSATGILRVERVLPCGCTLVRMVVRRAFDESIVIRRPDCELQHPTGWGGSQSLQLSRPGTGAQSQRHSASVEKNAFRPKAGCPRPAREFFS
jgi:hypothetical protein